MWPCSYSCPYLSVSYAVMNTCGFCPMVELSLDLCWGRSWVLTCFYIFLYPEVAWFVVAQRRAVITLFDCTFFPLADVYLWDLTFLLLPKLSFSKWQRIVPCFPTFSWWNSSLFFFPHFFMWELNFVLYVFFPLVVLQLYSIPIHFCCWYLVSITHGLHICSVLTVCNFYIM